MKKKAAALLRVSTNQQELDSQKEEINKVANAMGYEIPEKFFFGEKVSGGRPQFKKELDEKGNETGYLVAVDDNKSLQELKEVVQNPKTSSQIEMIFIWEISRISRRKSLLFTHLEFFNTLKKPIHFISHHITTLDLDTLEVDKIADANISFLAMYIEEEYRKIRERTQRGKRYVFLNDKNRYVGGLLSYGYKVNKETKKHYYEVVEEEADIVKLIFDKYVNDKWSFVKIANYLNNKGIPSPKGKLWEDSNVGRLLHNRNYIGEAKYGDMVGSMPAIIDKEIFNKVEEIIEDKREVYGRRTRKFNYPLKPLIKCGECGERLWGVVCASRKLYHDEHVNINKFRADAIVWNVVKNSSVLEWHFINDQDNSKDLIKEIEEKENLISLNNKGIDDYKKNRKKLINLVDSKLFSLDDIEEKAVSIDREIKELERENKELKSQIDIINQTLNNPKHDYMELQKMINEAGNDITTIEYLIKLFVSDVYIYNPTKNWVMIDIVYKNGDNTYCLYNRQSKLKDYYILNGMYYTYKPQEKIFYHTNLETNEVYRYTEEDVISNIDKIERYKYNFIEVDPFTAATNERVKKNQDRWNESYKEKRKETREKNKLKKKQDNNNM